MLSIEESKPRSSFKPFTITLRNDSRRTVTAFCFYAGEDRQCGTQAYLKPAATEETGIRPSEPTTLRMAAVLFGDGLAAGDGDPADVEWMRFEMLGFTLETERCVAILRTVNSANLDDAAMEALITSIDQPPSSVEAVVASLPPSALKEKLAGTGDGAVRAFVSGVGVARTQMRDLLKQQVAQVPIVPPGLKEQGRSAAFASLLSSTEQESKAYLATCKVDMGVE